MKISIIIPVYNVKQYLEQCVESIIQQNYVDYEILLIDDGSKDGSSQLCDIIANQDDRISVFYQKNKGVSKARNIGLENCTGEYILFVDSDDYLWEGILEKICQIAKEHKNPEIIGFQHLVGENETRAYLDIRNEMVFSGETYLSQVWKNYNFIPVWKYCYNRQFVEINKFKFFEGIKNEDELWTPTVLVNATRVIFLNTPGYYYRSRQGSIMKELNTKDRAKAYPIIGLELFRIFSKNQIENKKVKRFYEQKGITFLLKGMLYQIRLGDMTAYETLYNNSKYTLKKIRTRKNLILFFKLKFRVMMVSSSRQYLNVL